MKIVLSIAVVLCAVVALAQTTLAWEYNFRSKDWTPIVATKIRTVYDVPLVKSLDFSAIAGLQSGTAAPSVGLMVSKSFYVARGVEGLIGITGRYVQNRPPQFMGVCVGVKF